MSKRRSRIARTIRRRDGVILDHLKLAWRQVRPDSPFLKPVEPDDAPVDLIAAELLKRELET